MKKNKFMVAFATVTLTLLFLSCDDNSSDINDGTEDQSITALITLEASVEEVESVMDSYSYYAVSALEFDTAKTATSKTVILGNGCRDRSGFFSECANFQKETVDNTITITITFPEDCVDRNDNTISGTITVVKLISDTDKTRTITFSDFTINGHVINGTKTQEFTPENEEGNPQMSGTANISIETDQGTVTKVGTRLVVITSGGDTNTHWDDEKTITGSHTFTNAEGYSKVIEITTPLVKTAVCRFIGQGVKTYTKNEDTVSLDYGDGTCDNVATLTKSDGIVIEIALRKRRKKH